MCIFFNHFSLLFCLHCIQSYQLRKIFFTTKKDNHFLMALLNHILCISSKDIVFCFCCYHLVFCFLISVTFKLWFVLCDSKVRAEDPDVDANGQITYSIDFGNSKGYFTIDENTGEITLAKTIPLQENQILEFPLYVTAKDGRFFYYYSYYCCC